MFVLIQVIGVGMICFFSGFITGWAYTMRFEEPTRETDE